MNGTVSWSGGGGRARPTDERPPLAVVSSGEQLN